MSLTTQPAARSGLPALATAGGLPADAGFLGDAAPRTRGPILLGVGALALFVGGFAAWSGLAPLSEAAIAPGVIRSEGSRRTVAHLEGGIVREILVRDGDHVRRGQVLMRLDDVQSASTREALRASRWSLLAQEARTQAEIADARDVAFPADLLGATESRAREAMEGQRFLFAARQASLRSQVQGLEARIEQHRATIVSTEAQMASQRRQLDLLKREEGDVRALVSQGLERMPRLLGLQRQVASSEGNLGDLNAQIERARAQISEANTQIRAARDARLQEASVEARDLRPRLAETEERLRAAEDVSTRRDIVAPEDGTVLNNRFFNVGAVVRAGEPVMELVPAHDRLVAEVRVAPTDIDVVHPGLLAELRLPAFKQRLVPSLNGHVTVVGSDVVQDERRTSEFYKVTITFDEEQLRALNGAELRAGMPVEAQIQVGERSFARYMVQPLLDSFHRAFREQ